MRPPWLVALPLSTWGSVRPATYSEVDRNVDLIAPLIAHTTPAMLRALRPLLAKAPAARPLAPLGVSARSFAAQAEQPARKLSPVHTTSVEECV